MDIHAAIHSGEVLHPQLFHLPLLQIALPLSIAEIAKGVLQRGVQTELYFYVECNSEAITFHILGDQRFETDFRILCDIYTGLQLPECNKYLWKPWLVHIIVYTTVLE